MQLFLIILSFEGKFLIVPNANTALMGKMNFLDNAAPLESKEGQLTFVALIMMLYVIAIFLAVAIHEVLGHGVVTIIFGGEFYAVYISPGSGFISFYLPDSITNIQVGIIYMAGIAVQIVVGLIVFLFIFPKIKNFMLGLFTLMFSVAMLVHPSLYLFLGYFYQNGDTKYAAAILGIQPDIFVVAGIIMTGVFTLLVSIAALNFIGGFLDVGDEKVRNKILLMFWLPPILLSGISAIISASFIPVDDIAYTLTNAAVILLFLGMSIYLVPIFVEPEKTRNYRVSLKSIMSVMFVFMIILSVWIGAFGVSQESAHGILLHDPPIEVEQYYSDYSIGNVEIYAYHNGTAKVSIILRNQIADVSPLEEQIYHTFDQRPDWDRYIRRSKNMVISMFDLQRGIGENLTFSTSYGTVRALGVEDELGRVCTTYIAFYDAGTRQDDSLSPSEGGSFVPSIPPDSMIINFIDPWSTQNPRGYLDEVRISWGDDLRLDNYVAGNEYDDNILYNRGSMHNNSIGWKNINIQESPTQYRFIFTDSIEAPERL